MCELFGINFSKKIQLNHLLKEFFSDGDEHPHGWGMAFFYGDAVSLEKQPECSLKSRYLKQRLQAKIEADKMIAHIRLATRGTMDYENTHPFVRRDFYGRSYTFAHNGTIFESDVLESFVHCQEGGTDSERILCYLISRINAEEKEKGEPLSKEERFRLFDEIICEIAPENKLNLLLYDGELFYIHTNFRDSLYYCEIEGGVVVSTRPLDKKPWKKVPMNQLIAYENGKLIFTGTKHDYEFVENEEKMKLLFLDFANL
ncbi:MAG: class II glutamine amidotransferase [Anaerobutyricum sp.]|nr:class II glutamine amidotransferase [Anaerobutyricum sp.]